MTTMSAAGIILPAFHGELVEFDRALPFAQTIGIVTDHPPFELRLSAQLRIFLVFERRRRRVGWTKAVRCGPPGAGEAKHVLPMMARIGRFLAEKSRLRSRAVQYLGVRHWDDVRRGRLRALSRGVRRARSVPHYSDAPSRPFLPRRKLEGAGGAPDPPPHCRSDEPGNPAAARAHRRPRNAFGHVPARVMPQMAKRAAMRLHHRLLPRRRRYAPSNANPLVYS